MTGRGGALFAALLTFAACALSLGNPVYYYFAAALLLAFIYALFSCLWAVKTAQAEVTLPLSEAERGESAVMTISLRHAGLLPLGRLSMTYRAGNQGVREVVMREQPFVAWTRDVPLPTRHVGQIGLRAENVYAADLFGFFRLRARADAREHVFTVLPRPFGIDKPRFFKGDEGAPALARTQEDYTSPAEVRAYRPGDAMKRIHWKLSSRRRELIVRKYETPAPPDTLILLDNSPPCGAFDDEKLLALRDALCETAVAIARLQTADGSPVRLPLYGARADEYVSDTENNLTLLKRMLARQDFRQPMDYAGILRLELRRMRRTGATIMLTTHLSPAVVDAVSSIRRMGPSARLYLVSYTPETEENLMLVADLQRHLVEVCYVTPA